MAKKTFKDVAPILDGLGVTKTFVSGKKPEVSGSTFSPPELTKKKAESVLTELLTEKSYAKVARKVGLTKAQVKKLKMEAEAVWSLSVTEV